MTLELIGPPGSKVSDPPPRPRAEAPSAPQRCEGENSQGQRFVAHGCVALGLVLDDQCSLGAVFFCHGMRFHLSHGAILSTSDADSIFIDWRQPRGRVFLFTPRHVLRDLRALSQHLRAVDGTGDGVVEVQQQLATGGPCLSLGRKCRRRRGKRITIAFVVRELVSVVAFILLYRRTEAHSFDGLACWSRLYFDIIAQWQDKKV
mmetsp:Transcript_29674/g.63035  ORF Transcript_29674/g.63035 Transcript_29674/m.63035 type:complete len:204 (+) Transcript_29674:827-1438(+)